ncbi:OPT oligopeptide transporter [Rickenella mellea]|uniref:OPT oligopeptide transporter n=1 Tax=Rickenella mellea TaxID=50990 RepID=A0A4Y7QNC5_9AGAM|nr:OPT oligopeptide transporter [Rickenella mellea]
MDSKSNASLSIPSLRQRKALPDVPQDVALLHLNDPNYDFETYETSTISDDSFELGEKRRFTGALSIGHSVGTGTSDFDAESQAESRTDSRMHIRSTEAFDYADESPYAEVRAAVSNTDDPSMPVDTFRVWFLGLIFSALISGLNQFFSMRYPAVFITGLVALLASLPLGKGMERVLPTHKFTFRGQTYSLNPGPFNIKEHALIAVMANVSVGGAYATDIIATQRVVFDQNWGFAYQAMLCLSSQIIGFSFAGLVRQFLVWPSAMIWPSALVNSALLNTLHKNYGKRERGHMTRERFFAIALAGSFVWYWFPGYIFTALSIFNWVCWIAPNNIVVNQLFGYSSGLGMGFLTFDWAMVSYVGSPLVVPVRIRSSFVIITNVFFSTYLPMSASQAFDNTGAPYDALTVLSNGQFDLEKYKAYSPLFLPITFVLNYALEFASLTAVIVHTVLWYRNDIARQFRRTIKDHRDVHSRLMSAYPEVPQYWYGILGLSAFVMGVITIELWDTKLPVWALVLALIVSLVFLVPVGMIQAITNQTVGLNVFAELLVGYFLPGRPVAMMIFKTFSFISMSQALSFVGDLKLGHYMKIPPRTMFIAQVIPTIVTCLVVVAVQIWMFANIPDLCTQDQPSHFICPGTRVFATAAMVWGGIGPRRMFSEGLYQPVLYFFLIGALLPIPFYFLAKRFPLSIFRFINFPAAFAGLSALPPATGINYSAWFMMGSVFQYFMRRFHFRWWMRYNYILSAALDSGVAFALIVIFFTVQLPKGGFNINWWGNTVWLNTADTNFLPLKTVASGQIFGPQTWS